MILATPLVLGRQAADKAARVSPPSRGQGVLQRLYVMRSRLVCDHPERLPEHFTGVRGVSAEFLNTQAKNFPKTLSGELGNNLAQAAIPYRASTDDQPLAVNAFTVRYGAFSFSSGGVESRHARNGQPVRKGNSGSVLATERYFRPVPGKQGSHNGLTVPLAVSNASGLTVDCQRVGAQLGSRVSVRPARKIQPKETNEIRN